MKLNASARVGFTAIVLILVLYGIFKNIGCDFLNLRGKVGTYSIYATFESVKGLTTGAQVQLNGNPVGEVGEITNDGYGAVMVQLLIRMDQIIHKHAVFTISRDNIFGGYMVFISEMPSGKLISGIKDGEAIIRIAKRPVSEAEKGNGIEKSKSYLDVGGSIWKDGQKIGSILVIGSDGVRTEVVRISLNEGVTLDEHAAFVPYDHENTGIGGLIVYDRLEPGAQVNGTREAGPEDLVVKADASLEKITAQATQIMVKLDSLLGSIEELLDKEQIRELIDTLSKEAIEITDQVSKLTKRLNTMLTEYQPLIEGAITNFEGLSSDARQLISDINEYNTPELREQIKSIASNLADSTETLDKILSDLESYTSDKEMMENLKDAINKGRATLEEARATLTATRETVDKVNENIKTFGGMKATGEFTLRYAPDPDRWVGSVDSAISFDESDSFLALGFNDIGKNDRINAQLGLRLTDETSGRIGIYRGKLGAGADWKKDPFSVTSNLYDPNDLQWDVYGGYAFLPEMGIVVGVEDLLKDKELNLGLVFRF